MPQEVGCCTKYFLFSFNVLFWIIGLTLLGAGIWAWSEKGFFDNLSVISSLPIDPVLVIIIVALVMFILSFSGCLGSLRENIFLLKFFSVCLGVIFFAELVAGILGFVYKDWFHQQFALFVNKTIKGYRDDPDLQNVIDFSQEYLKCCGGDVGVHDWDNNVYFNCTSVIMVNDVRFTPVESCGVPFSCCVKESTIDVVNTQCGYATRLPTVTAAEQSQKIYITGCIASFEDWLKTNLYMVAGIFIGIALVQIIPICFAQNLISDIEAVKAGWIEERWAELLSKTKFSIQGLHASLDLENKLRRQLLNSRYLQLVHSPATDNAETRSDFVVLRVSRHSTARESWSLLSLLTDLKQPLRRSRSSPSDVNLI